MKKEKDPYYANGTRVIVAGVPCWKAAWVKELGSVGSFTIRNLKPAPIKDSDVAARFSQTRYLAP